MKNVSKPCLVAMASVAVSCLPCTAAELAPSAGSAPVQLPQYEVVEQPLASLPEVDRFASATTTISENQLRDLKALDFASALRRTPGVTITRYNQIGAFGGGEGGAVFMRGLGASRPGGEIKTMIDGVPKMNGIFNHPLLDLLSVDSAARIDVHSRATPLDFSNTFAAVNITTPRIEAAGQVTRATVASGSFGTVVERLDHGAKQGAFDYYLSQSFRRSDGARADSDGRMENYFLRLGWAFSPQWNLSYELNRTHNRATDPGVEGATPGVTSTRGEIYETADWLHIAALTHRNPRAEGSVRAYWNEGEGNWTRRQFSGNSDSLNDWRLSGVRWRETTHLWEGGEILAGTDLDYDRGTSRSVPLAPAQPNVFGPSTVRILSPYAGVNHTLTIGGVDFTPSAGVRYYDHNRLDSRWAPQAGVTAVAGSTKWHAGFNRAVNYPGLEVQALSQFMPALGKSWMALKPEQADQFELGVRQLVTPDAAVAVTVFRNQAHDRYVIAFPPPPPPRYLNLGSYRTEGIEVTAETALNRELALFTGLSWLRTTPGGLPYAPKYTLTGGLNWRIATGWLLSTDGSYASSMHAYSEARTATASNPTMVGAQFLLNARLSRRFAWPDAGKMHAEIYISGENLTNRKFAYTPGYPVPGINLMAGVRFER
ncbi:MAG: TonB-dependent receptor plug domain-containing protein [Opitutaceae bacterium]|nr:TonB-dependent receptor plug domain-containing protein [Opitutaceae bacterium]